MMAANKKANYNLGSGYRAMNKLLARDAGSSLFCMSDIMAVGAMRALTDAGLRVPQDISVLGFDGIELGQYGTAAGHGIPAAAGDCRPERVAPSAVGPEKAAPPRTRVVSARASGGRICLRNI